MTVVERVYSAVRTDSLYEADCVYSLMKVGTDFIEQDKYCCQINYLASLNKPASAIGRQL